MMVRVLPANERDAARVLAAISQQTLDEFEVAGTDPAKAIQNAIARQERMFVSVTGETPLTLFGFADYGGYLSMWTIATKAFFDLGAPGVFCTRRFFRNLDLAKPLIVVTTSPHPDTDRWLRLLGFDLIGGTPERREFRLAC
ncbi:MAG: hypothetical protein JSR35_08770 [Proteobacteria bacterium]|nr:hypothetical protein [Pseudomonadota bacterium]